MIRLHYRLTVLFGTNGELAFAKDTGLGAVVSSLPTLRGVGFEYNSTGAAVDQQLVGGFAKTLQLPVGTEANPFVSAIATGEIISRLSSSSSARRLT